MTAPTQLVFLHYCKCNWLSNFHWKVAIEHIGANSNLPISDYEFFVVIVHNWYALFVPFVSSANNDQNTGFTISASVFLQWLCNAVCSNAD